MKTSLLVGGSLPASPGAVLAKKKKKNYLILLSCNRVLDIVQWKSVQGRCKPRFLRLHN